MIRTRPRSLEALRRALHDCRACPLWERATQAVGGAGAAHAPLFLVGEQPGDVEDREGAPFVGPAGGLLERALEAAGLARNRVYVTNAVKHFKWIPRGKRRLHKTPSQREIAACLDWLLDELALVRPRVILCLGATAARAVLGRVVRVTQERGKPLPSSLAGAVFVTVHPSAILRMTESAARRQAFDRFVADLALARRAAESA